MADAPEPLEYETPREPERWRGRPRDASYWAFIALVAFLAVVLVGYLSMPWWFRLGFGL
jgi:hypothetical protein